MSLFRLVQGSTQNAPDWGLLVPEIQKGGHRTLAVDFPSGEAQATDSLMPRCLLDLLTRVRIDVQFKPGRPGAIDRETDHQRCGAPPLAVARLHRFLCGSVTYTGNVFPSSRLAELFGDVGVRRFVTGAYR